MELKLKQVKHYQLLDPDGRRGKVRVSRIDRPTEQYRVMYWKTIYELVLENKEDRIAFISGVSGKQVEENDFNRTFWDTDNNVKDYVSKTYFCGKKIRMIGRDKPIRVHMWEEDPITLEILVDDEATEIAKPSNKELKLWAQHEEAEQNQKVIKNFFGTNIQELGKKYHLSFCEYGDGTLGLDFNSQPDIVEFFKTAIKELITDKLTELGINSILKEDVIRKGLNKAWMYGPVVDEIKVNKAALQ